MEIIKSSEHKGVKIYKGGKARVEYYGYMTIKNRDLGDMVVSILSGERKEIRLDGYPWDFLKDTVLTNEQKDYIEKNKTEIMTYIS